jgi:hypothetical protein
MLTYIPGLFAVPVKADSLSYTKALVLTHPQIRYSATGDRRHHAAIITTVDLAKSLGHLTSQRGYEGSGFAFFQFLSPFRLQIANSHWLYNNNNNSIFTPGTDPLRAHAGDTVRYGENLHTFVAGKPR